MKPSKNNGLPEVKSAWMLSKRKQRWAYGPGDDTATPIGKRDSFGVIGGYVAIFESWRVTMSLNPLVKVLIVTNAKTEKSVGLLMVGCPVAMG